MESTSPRREEEADDEDEFVEDVDSDVEQEQITALKAQFSPEQLDRYSKSRSAKFPAATVAKLMCAVTGTKPKNAVAKLMAGVAKVFVGELIEEARAIAEARGESAKDNVLLPLTPDHVMEAYRVLRQRGKVPAAASQRLFRRPNRT
eukprot:m51a1_g2119 putative transcription initiation factor tfiid subunit 11-like (147) ;mRNA; r:1664903-1665683